MVRRRPVGPSTIQRASRASRARSQIIAESIPGGFYRRRPPFRRKRRHEVPAILDPATRRYVPIAWDDAFRLLADELRAAGPERSAFYTSGQCTDLAGYANTSKNLYQGDYHLEGKDNVETYGASSTLTWDLGSMSLISVTGFDHAHAP